MLDNFYKFIQEGNIVQEVEILCNNMMMAQLEGDFSALMKKRKLEALI
jgi:hypothetical protein